MSQKKTTFDGLSETFEPMRTPILERWVLGFVRCDYHDIIVYMAYSRRSQHFKLTVRQTCIGEFINLIVIPFNFRILLILLSITQAAHYKLESTEVEQIDLFETNKSNVYKHFFIDFFFPNSNYSKQTSIVNVFQSF